MKTIPELNYSLCLVMGIQQSQKVFLLLQWQTQIVSKKEKLQYEW
jgi:hypothetical protein